MCRVSAPYIKLKTRERTPNFDRIHDTGCNSEEKMRVSERELKYGINTQRSWTGRSGEPLN